MAEPFELVEVRRDGPVATVAMNRASKRNAMNEQLLTELRLALQQEQDHAGTRTLVLTGHGSVFSAGADRSPVAGLEGEALAQAFAPVAVKMARLIAQLMVQLVTMPKLVVAAINGHAAGGAVITGLGCDFRVCSEEALFWMPEMGMGRAIGEPSLQTLLACVGPLVTKDIVISGRRLDAAELARLGLVNRVAPAQRVLPLAVEWAHSLATLDEQASRTIKARANASLVEIWQRALRG